ncbi:MAG: hypothetical protein HYT31_01795 [Parcubacteria group bacterium]|nr:hypothetical protein [Parcubacteria group bacterium]
MRFRIRSPVVRVAMFAALALVVTASFMATPTDALAPATTGTDQIITTAPMTHDPPGSELVTLATTANLAAIEMAVVKTHSEGTIAGAEATGAIIVRQTTSTASRTETAYGDNTMTAWRSVVARAENVDAVDNYPNPFN